ncbi:MAG: type 4a pilus biogenesis protein PilO [Firmicutes bacterium]|nr:type 4a pilus biogenesis protein PilO [Bacillota bacterium]
MSFSLYNPKSRVQLLLLIVLLLLVGFYFWYYEPARAARDQAKQQYELVKQEITYGRQRAVNLQRYAEQVSELKAELDQVERRLAGGNRILLFLQALENGSRQAGVKLLDLRPQRAITVGETVEQPVEVVFSGSLPNTQRFIQIIEELSYPSEVRQAQIEAPESGSGGELVTSLTVIMFSLQGGEV